MIPRPRFPGAVAHSDARLVELARRGDERAFELIVRRHRPSLVAYARRLGLGDARAEDAVQQAVLSAWLALCRGDDVRDVGPWLGRITHNRSVNLLRSGARAQPLPPDIERAVSAPFALEDGLALRQTLDAVAALPPRQRDALVLSAVEGRSYEEVASALGVSPGAVRGLLHRARENLRAASAALAPLPLARALGDALRRPGAGRLAEAAAPGSTGATSLAGLRAAAAAVATAVLAAGVAVGPGLISGHHGRPGRPDTAAASSGPVAAVQSGARSHSSASPRRPVAAHSHLAATHLAAGGAGARPAPRAGAPVHQTPRSTPRHAGGGGTNAEEPVSTSPSQAVAAATPPTGEPAAEAPVTSSPAPEPPPVTVEPEAPRTREAPEKEEEPPGQEEEKETPGETPSPTERERPSGKDN